MPVKKQKRSLSESAKQIVALRTAMKMNRIEFARRFNVGRGAESHWETGRFEPSKEKYFEMGNIVLEKNYPGLSFIWFWERAGIKATSIYRASDSFAAYLDRNKSSIEEKGLFHAPLLRDLNYISEPNSAPAEAIEAMLTLPAFFSSSRPESIVCLRMPDDLSSLARAPLYDFHEKRLRGQKISMTPSRPDLSAPMFRKGDIAIVDLSASDLYELEEQLIALSFSIQTKFASWDDERTEWSRPKLHVGWLRRDEIRPTPYDFDAKQLRVQQSAAAESKSEKIQPEYFYYLYPSPDASLRPLASMITNTGPRPTLITEYKLVGRVVGWIAGNENLSLPRKRQKHEKK